MSSSDTSEVEKSILSILGDDNNEDGMVQEKALRKKAMKRFKKEISGKSERKKLFFSAINALKEVSLVPVTRKQSDPFNLSIYLYATEKRY